MTPPSSFTRSRNLLRRCRRIFRPRAVFTSLGCLLLLAMLNGAQPAKRVRPPKVKAWLDVKGLCVLSLGTGETPDTPAELVAALTEGWQRGMRLPDPSKVVTVDGDRFSSLNSLRIDLTDGAIDPRKKSEKVSPRNKPESRLGVGQFDLIGQPLLCAKSKLNMTFSCTNVHMDVDHDRTGKPILLLADAQRQPLAGDDPGRHRAASSA